MLLYSYLNLESTKTRFGTVTQSPRLYSYLNLESTKTKSVGCYFKAELYSYLNLESTKTSNSSILVFVAQNHYKVLDLTRQYYSSKYFNNIGLTGSIRNFIFIHTGTNCLIFSMLLDPQLINSYEECLN